MKQFYVILIGTLILASSCLRIKYHESPQSYLSALKNQQSGLTTQLTTINSQVSEVLKQVSSQTKLQTKISLLEQAILKQKAQLSSLSLSLANPLNETTWSCQNYIGTSQQQLIKYTSNIVTTATILNSTINAIQNSTITPIFTPDANAALNIAQTLQKDVFAVGGNRVPSLNMTNMSNLLSPNWVTGDNNTIQQIDQQTQTINQNNGYVMACPINTPFFDGNKCITCLNNQYFNIQTKSCVTCNIFDATTRSCKSNNTTTPTNNTNNNTTNTTTNTTIPLYNGTNLESGLNRTILPSNITVSSLQSTPVQPCPASQPFFANKQCINCNPPNPLFNYSSSQCTTCPMGTNFIPEQHICLSPQIFSVTNIPAAANFLILPNNVTISDLQDQQQSSSNIQMTTPCPPATPFYNNQSCITCAKDLYFNILTLKCQSCPANAQYNVTMHQCIVISYYTNLTNRNWISTNPANVRATVANASTIIGATACPANTPFYDVKKCLGCRENQYFNFDVLKCEACPANNVFDANIHSCTISKANLFQTNPTTAPNLIYAGTSKGEWMTIYLQNQQNKQDCPANLPYFDGITCISCPQQYPYFNLGYKVCHTCQIGSTYDQSVHECLSSGGNIIAQQPNIQKMVASIFT